MAVAALWVALPDLWLPVGWLALVLMLGLTARRFATLRLALQADALALSAAVVLVFHHMLPLALFRLDYPDPSRHLTETGVLSLAALCYWVYAEVYPRFLRSFSAGLQAETDSALDLNLAAWQAFVLPIASLLGTAMAATALWVALPTPWIVVGWLALVLLLGLAADWVKSGRLALQADLLAVAAGIGFFVWTSWSFGWKDHEAPSVAAVALFYAGMRRKMVPAGLAHYVAPAYSWAGTLLLACVTMDLCSVVALAPVWAALGLALFEIGCYAREGFLRWQGFLMLALAFVDFLWEHLPQPLLFPLVIAMDWGPLISFSLSKSLLLEVLILAAVGYWLMERTRNRERCARREHLAGLATGGLGTLSISLWFAYRFPSVWVPVPGGEAWVTAIWAGMATILLTLAWLVRRKALLVHAIALVVAVLARGFFVDLVADSPAGFWNGPLFHLGLAAVILLAALPFAFRLRREGFFASSTLKPPADLDLLLRSPEQIFFFAAFALEVVALAVKLSSGHITIAWSLLGLCVFLFALAVGERSYRLAGLGLLLVSVAKILLMDVWQLSSSDRYTTLIVLGLALLAVSFLYTRFGVVIRRYL
jgi:hypothetical protein